VEENLCPHIHYVSKMDKPHQKSTYIAVESPKELGLKIYLHILLYTIV